MMNITPKFAAAMLLVTVATTVEAVPPQVVTRTPARQKIDASPQTTIQVGFNTNIDPTSVNAITFRAFGRWSGPASGTYQVTGSTVTFTPSEPFFFGEYVTVSLSKGIKSTLAEPMAFGHAWSFWTRSASASLNLTYVTRYDTRLPTDSWVQPYGAYAGDIDNDGWCDLFIPCEQTDDMRIFMNNGAGLYPGGFTRKTPANTDTPSPNEAGDFDNNGEIDIAIGNVTNNRVTVMLGNGAGDFPTVASLTAAEISVRGVGVLDLNGDGWDDIVCSAKTNTGKTCMFLNNGNGTFAPKVDLEAGVLGEWGIAVADINNDGIMDVFL